MEETDRGGKETVLGGSGTIETDAPERVPGLQVQAPQEGAQKRQRRQSRADGLQPGQVPEGDQQEDVPEHGRRHWPTKRDDNFGHCARAGKQGGRAALVAHVRFHVGRRQHRVQAGPPKRHHRQHHERPDDGAAEHRVPHQNRPFEPGVQTAAGRRQRHAVGTGNGRHRRGPRAATLAARQGADQPDVRLARLAGERVVLRRVAAVRPLVRVFPVAVVGVHAAAALRTAAVAAQARAEQPRRTQAEHVGHDHGGDARVQRRRAVLARVRRVDAGLLRRPRRRAAAAAQPRVRRVAHVRQSDGRAAEQRLAHAVHHQRAEGRPAAAEGRVGGRAVRAAAHTPVFRRSARQDGADGLRVGVGGAGTRRLQRPGQFGTEHANPGRHPEQ